MLAPSIASAAVFNLNTLDEHKSGSTVLGWYDHTSGAKVTDKNINETAPWTVDAGTSAQASLNWVVPSMGNQGSKTYVSSGGGAGFPYLDGQVQGNLNFGFSGWFQQNNNFPMWFAFSNPNYDGLIAGCSFNCATITGVPVTLNSFYTTGDVDGMTVTGYASVIPGGGGGQNPIPGDVMTLHGTPAGNIGLQQWTLNWTGVEYFTISQNGLGGVDINDIQVNEPVLSAVPEPSTWAMMLLGFVGLAWAFRSRRRVVGFA